MTPHRFALVRPLSPSARPRPAARYAVLFEERCELCGLERIAWRVSDRFDSPGWVECDPHPEHCPVLDPL